MKGFTIPTTYCNQDFDETSQRAGEITEEDRRAGREAPLYGYSQSAWDRASAEYRAAVVVYWS